MQMNQTHFTKESLRINCAEETELISQNIRRLMATFKRRGLIVALSGGIDSSVTAALAVRALGPERVFGIHMPDKDSSAETLSFSQSISNHFGFNSVIEDITGPLEAMGCYRRQEEAIRQVVPQYGPDWKSKVVINNALTGGFSLSSIVVQAPDGTRSQHALPEGPYLGIVAATNFKQLIRKMMEYYHADRLNYAVTGTPNLLEYDQGFFVKLGDGAADVKPIAHLYKTQVYQLAEYLGVPEKVRSRPPTTDTYSLEQGQDEFYFSVPHTQLDLCLYGKNRGLSAEVVAPVAGLTAEQVNLVYRDIDRKRASTKYLHLPPQLVGKVEGPVAGYK